MLAGISYVFIISLAKSVEKDEFIPFISKLKMFVKFAPTSAFKRAEL